MDFDQRSDHLAAEFSNGHSRNFFVLLFDVMDDDNVVVFVCFDGNDFSIDWCSWCLIISQVLSSLVLEDLFEAYLNFLS